MRKILALVLFLFAPLVALAQGFPTTQTTVTVSVTNTFQQAVAASSLRKGCTIQYVGANTGYVYFGTLGSATTSNSFQLTAKQSVNCATFNNFVVTQAVNVTATAGDVFVVTYQ